MAPPVGELQHDILIVEDDPTTRRLLLTTLSRPGWNILEAATGRGALTMAKAANPDLVVLDVRIPPPDGLEVCRRLKSDPKLRNTPVVMVSAAVQEGEIDAGLAAGADSYLIKPFSPLRLLTLVDELLSAPTA